MSGPPVRKPDPHRFQHTDLMPEGAKTDVDFMRMVQDLEDQTQNRAGWLFSRGAFDRGDLIYLRDEEEKRRYVELDIMDNERSQFQAMRARAEEEEERKAAAARAAAAAAARKAQQEKQDKKRLLVPMVRLKRAGSSQAAKAPSVSAASGSEGGPEAKRPRPDEGAGSAGDAEPGSARQGAAAEAPQAQQEQAPQQQQQQDSGGRSGSGGGLAGLLGGYGSDSDSGSGSGEGSPGAEGGPEQLQQQLQQGPGQGQPTREDGGVGAAAGVLPSAAELLGGP